jgi:hypothetical protein
MSKPREDHGISSLLAAFTSTYLSAVLVYPVLCQYLPLSLILTSQTLLVDHWGFCFQKLRG